jgi:hypothetical protein
MIIIKTYNFIWGNVVAQLVEALCYKLEGRGFQSRHTMALGLTQPLTQMSIRKIPGG